MSLLCGDVHEQGGAHRAPQDGSHASQARALRELREFLPRVRHTAPSAQVSGALPGRPKLVRDLGYSASRRKCQVRYQADPSQAVLCPGRPYSAIRASVMCATRPTQASP